MHDHQLPKVLRSLEKGRKKGLEEQSWPSLFGLTVISECGQQNRTKIQLAYPKPTKIIQFSPEKSSIFPHLLK
jgi:hypothetical protein